MKQSSPIPNIPNSLCLDHSLFFDDPWGSFIESWPSGCPEYQWSNLLQWILQLVPCLFSAKSFPIACFPSSRCTCLYYLWTERKWYAHKVYRTEICYSGRTRPAILDYIICEGLCAFAWRIVDPWRYLFGPRISLSSISLKYWVMYRPSRLHCAQGTRQIVPLVLRYPAQALGAPIGDRSAELWWGSGVNCQGTIVVLESRGTGKS